MPLLGLKDRKGKCIKWEDIAKGKGDFEDPPSILLALFSPRTKYCDFSVTELLNDPYQEQMKRRFGFFESVDDMGDRMLGSSFHALMEQKAEHIKGMQTMSEERMTVEFPVSLPKEKKPRVIKIGGTTDLILNNDTMWDYKTVTVGKLALMSKGKAYDGLIHWQHQLNIYRWLMWKTKGITLKKLYIRAIVKDWRFYEFRKHGFDYKEYPRGLVIPITVMPFDDIEHELTIRVRQHVIASRVPDDSLHEVGECDTWSNHTRCEHYCPLKRVCYFRNDNQELD